MKDDDGSQTDRALDRVLREWRVEAPLPPRFQQQVWARIGQEQTAEGRSIWRSVVAFIGGRLATPRVAYSYLALLILLGVAGGAWAAQREVSRLDSQLGSRYVQSIDPYLNMAAHP